MVLTVAVMVTSVIVAIGVRCSPAIMSTYFAARSARTRGRRCRCGRIVLVVEAGFWPETDAELVPVLAELSDREPIFHRPEFGSNLADFEQQMAPEGRLHPGAATASTAVGVVALAVPELMIEVEATAVL